MRKFDDRAPAGFSPDAAPLDSHLGWQLPQREGNDQIALILGMRLLPEGSGEPASVPRRGRGAEPPAITEPAPSSPSEDRSLPYAEFKSVLTDGRVSSSPSEDRSLSYARNPPEWGLACAGHRPLQRIAAFSTSE